MAITHKIWGKNETGGTTCSVAEKCMTVPHWAGKMLFVNGIYEQLGSGSTKSMFDNYDYNLTDADAFITNGENSKIGIYCSGAPERLTATYMVNSQYSPVKLFDNNEGIWSAEIDITYAPVTGLVETSKESGTSQYSEYVEYNDGYRVNDMFLFNDTGEKVCTYGLSGDTNNDEFISKTGTNRFKGCEDLVSVKLLYSMNTISEGTFSGCTSFTGYSNPNYVSYISGNAFSDCTALENATLGRHLQKIGNGVYSGCTSLTSITFDGIEDIESSTAPQKGFTSSLGLSDTMLDTIPYKCFYGCSSLSNTIFRKINYTGDANYSLTTKSYNGIYFPENIKKIGDMAFYDCSSLTAVSLNKVNTLGEKAFNNTSIREIDMTPVSAISSYAFYENNVIERITLSDPQNNLLVEIPEFAFYNCQNLIEMSIGPNCERIGAFAFAYSENLCTINCYAQTPPDVNDTAFSVTGTCVAGAKLHVPVGSKNSYVANEIWLSYANEDPNNIIEDLIIN